MLNTHEDSATQLFANELIQHAADQRATDIHIEPLRAYCRIRFRVDGLLQEINAIPHWQGLRLITHLKLAAELNITEKRLPQDGRLLHHLKNTQAISLRLSTCPHHLGEKLALRLFYHQDKPLLLSDCGLLPQQKIIVNQWIHQPHGLILITGPTNSGKTTTLYAILNELNQLEKNILTIEDPIEMELNGITQVNVHPRIGLTFSTALRSFLRQDPDIILIGEIRDQETADIALQSAQTGHLVLASLHTTQAITSLARLERFHLPESSLRSCLHLVLAQRLLRRVCQHCKGHTIHCSHCYQGYRGQTAVFECWQPQIETQPACNLHQAGFEKQQQGITNHAELIRVLGKHHALD